MSKVWIGTSGWNYPSGPGAWNGVFYPARHERTRPRRGAAFDELSYYAERFDTVEVNSTFYRSPAQNVARAWVRRTPPGFLFSLKLFQKFTHPEMYRRAVGGNSDVGLVDVDEFRRGVDPIAQAGKLGALLAQFPASFKNAPESRDYLDWLLRTLHEYPVAVELRHRTWSDDVRSTLLLLNEHQAAWAQIDEPKFRFSIRQNYLPNVTGFYYMRLHGRNADKWWRHENRDERYDYLYTRDELRPFADTADAARRLVKRLFVYLNNHFSAKAVANAVVLKDLVGEPITGEYTTEMQERYPEIRALTATSAARQRALLHTSS
jgi:uncharacterized protein YecE (DUF72 family)